MRIDLHCHSKYSKRPTLWFMQKLGCPESFTEPIELYRFLRKRGMAAVTITDHNVIDGALEIAELENAFLSCEYTTYFPEDRCKVHILAYDITENQHRELSKARENIHDLVDYFHAENIVHVCAHPFFWVNDKLTVNHIEQLVLLFKNWEVNGDLNKEMNDSVLRLLANLSQSDVERMANKHGFAPRGPRMWCKHVTAGSDDHSSLNLGSAHTEVPNASTLAEFWSGLATGRARVHVEAASPHMLARNYYGIAYQFYRAKLGLERNVSKDVSLRFMDRTLRAQVDGVEPWLNRFYLRLAERRRVKNTPTSSHTLFEIARIEAEKRIRNDAGLMALMRDGQGRPKDLDVIWFDLVRHIGDKLLLNIGNRLIERVLHARLFDIFESLGSAAALYLLLAPYFVSYALFARERRWSQEILAALAPGTEKERPHKGPHVAHFTDTFHDVNGVARTLQQQLAIAQEQEKEYSVITCRRDPATQTPGLHQFAPIGTYALPEYEEIEVLTPPFLEMLRHCYEEEFTHIHIATPGPVGLAGLAIARILQLPVSGTYHTAFPQYAKTLTEDGYIEDLVWRYMIWFYDQMDAVYVPSRFTGSELVTQGLAEAKIRVYPRGIDTERFHPRNRNREIYTSLGVPEGTTIILSVGRVSKEKGLDILCKAFRSLAETQKNIHLVITGDGPHRGELESLLHGCPVTFTGYQEGETLAQLYASADLLVMPSTTDTFGNVVLEAQASGIPVIVNDRCATCENVVPDRTGLVIEANNPAALKRAMEDLVNDRNQREEMSLAARAYMEDRDFKSAFEQLFGMYTANAEPKTATNEFRRLLTRSLEQFATKAS